MIPGIEPDQLLLVLNKVRWLTCSCPPQIPIFRATVIYGFVLQMIIYPADTSRSLSLSLPLSVSLCLCVRVRVCVLLAAVGRCSEGWIQVTKHS